MQFGIGKHKLYYLKTDNNEAYLSKREFQCLFLLGMHKTAQEIASVMRVSKRTIKYYSCNIRLKLGCKHNNDLFDIIASNNLLQMLKTYISGKLTESSKLVIDIRETNLVSKLHYSSYKIHRSNTTHEGI